MRAEDSSHLEPNSKSALDNVPQPRNDAIPEGWEITEKGVFSLSRRDGPQLVCGPAWVEALTSDADGKRGWGLVIRWRDQDDKFHERAFKRHRLHEQGTTLVQELVDAGLFVMPGCERQVLKYLGNIRPDSRVRSVDRLGWLSGVHEPVYVLPDQVVTLANLERVVFQPERHAPTAETMGQAGSLKGWQQAVARPCQDHPVLVFSLLVPFAGPLLSLAGLDSGGFHLYGNSSQGKTTALQVAASVCGNGADPATDDYSYVQNWNATGNALESVAAAHNDGLLPLDEIGTCDAKNFGKVVYNLFGGKGKRRMGKEAHLRERQSWRIVGFSSGEVSVRQKIEQTGGQGALAGHLNRFIDIPVRDRLVQPGIGDSAELVNRLKRACTTNYGYALPAFVEKLLAYQPHMEGLQTEIQVRLDNNQALLTGQRRLDAVQQRIVRRFALILVSGELACELGVLPLDRKICREAVRYVMQAWAGAGGNLTTAQRGVLKVRDFIQKHGSARFQDACVTDGEGAVKRDRAGYYNSYLFMFTDAGFEEACDGANPSDVAEELRKQGMLYANDTGRVKSRHQIGSQRHRVYAVRKTVLELDEFLATGE